MVVSLRSLIVVIRPRQESTHFTFPDGSVVPGTVGMGTPETAGAVGMEVAGNVGVKPVMDDTAVELGEPVFKHESP